MPAIQASPSFESVDGSATTVSYSCVLPHYLLSQLKTALSTVLGPMSAMVYRYACTQRGVVIVKASYVSSPLPSTTFDCVHNMLTPFGVPLRGCPLHQIELLGLMGISSHHLSEQGHDNIIRKVIVEVVTGNEFHREQHVLARNAAVGFQNHQTHLRAEEEVATSLPEPRPDGVNRTLKEAISPPPHRTMLEFLRSEIRNGIGTSVW